MLSLLSLVFPVLMGPSLPQVGPSALSADEPPVRLWLNGDRRFETGDRARVQVEARDDGFLLVLNYDTDGRVRVLYPVDPRDDGFVRGGRRYEVRDPRDRESFVVGREGAGFVYVALSPDPWDLRAWSRGSSWDYDLISVSYDSSDPERDLTGLLERVAGARGFDYDLVEYFVHDVEIVRYEYTAPRYYAPGVWAGDPWCDPYWSTGWFCSARPGVVVSYGRRYGGAWWSVGYGPSWYWPGSSWYHYRPYSYGRGYTYTYHRPWVWNSPTYRPINRPVIVGRSRDYTTGRLSPWTFASGENYTGPSSNRPNRDLPDNYRPRDGGVRSRPVDDRAEVPQARQGRPVTERSNPPASAGRARPTSGRAGGDDQPAATPAGRRSGGDATPAARPAPNRQPAAPPRARSRGSDPEESRDAAATRAAPSSGRTEPTARRAITSESSRPVAARARPVESRPAARQESSAGRASASSNRPAARQAPASRSVESRPAVRPSARQESSAGRASASSNRPAARQAPASRPAASRPAAQSSPPPRATPRQAPARASSPPAASSGRRDPPARSRGNGRGNNS